MTIGTVANQVVAFTGSDGRTYYAARVFNSSGQIAPGALRAVPGRSDVINLRATAAAVNGRLPTREEAARLVAITRSGSVFTPQPLLPGDRADDTPEGIARQRAFFQGNPLVEFGNSEKIIFDDSGVPAGRVGIYGARQEGGGLWQPASTIHGDTYFDASHTGAVVILDELPEGATVAADLTGELTPEQLAEVEAAGSGTPVDPGGVGGYGNGQYSSFADCMASQLPPTEPTASAVPPGLPGPTTSLEDRFRSGATEAGGTRAIDPRGSGGNSIVMANANARRRRPLPPLLYGTLTEGMNLSGLTGLEFVVNSGGQLNQEEGTGTIRHNIGSSSAADGDFYLNGRRLNPTNSADRETLAQIMRGMWQAGIRGFGHGAGYMGNGRFHLDLQGNTPGRPGGNYSDWGGDTSWIRSAIRGIDPGGLTPEQQAEWEEFARQNPELFSPGGSYAAAAANCLPPGGLDGCAPVSPGVLGAASSIAQGEGLAVPTELTEAVDAVEQTELGEAAKGLQDAVQKVSTGIDEAVAAATGGLDNALTQVTQGVSEAVQQLGGNIAPALTDVVPTAFNTLISGGRLSDVVANSATQILGNAAPQLGNFLPYFNAAAGAVASGAGIQGLLGSVSNLAFGQMQQQLGNLINIDGFNPGNLINSIGNIEGFEGIDNFVGEFTDTLNNGVQMLGNLDSVLPNLVNAPDINAFSSLFGNFNDMVTQGFGALSSDLLNFGNDLARLGDLGDLDDIFNLVSPTQIARQIVERGIEGLAEPLLEQISIGNINLLEPSNTNQDQIISQVLNEFGTGTVLQNLKQSFSISDSVPLETAADLLKTEKLLPSSSNSINFENFKDIAPTISLACNNGTGNLRSLSDLGNLIRTLENTEKFTELNQELAPVRTEELSELSEQFPTNSFFGNTPVLADFIGTAGGYIHTDAFRKKAILLEELNATGVLDDFKALNTVLTNTLNGDYTGGSVITVPDTAGYTFEPAGYSSLDAAATALVSAIETELTTVRTNLENDTDPEPYRKFTLLESLHQESARYLAHEKNMRLKYGVEFGDPNREILYTGDGSSLFFAIRDSSVSKIRVHVDGIRQREIKNYTYNSTNRNIEFVSPPAAGALIEIEYVDPTVAEVQVSNNDVWQFASNLENYGTETGFGNTSEFLFKVASNDFHGQRIKATMMQGRNKARLERAGINCPGINRVDGATDTQTVNYIDRTGIWSPEPDRAGEIWLYNQTGKGSYNTYYENQLKTNRDLNRGLFDRIAFQIADRLIFRNNRNLSVTTQFLDFYDRYESAPQTASGGELLLSISAAPNRDGYVLGPYKQIVSEIIKSERFSDINYNEPLSDQTKAYLQSANIDIRIVVTLLQKIMLYNLSKYFGLSEKQILSVYEVPSVSKALIYNFNNNVQ